MAEDTIQPGQLIAIGWELSNIQAMLNCAHKRREESPMEWDLVIAFLLEKKGEAEAELERVSALFRK